MSLWSFPTKIHQRAAPSTHLALPNARALNFEANTATESFCCHMERSSLSAIITLSVVRHDILKCSQNFSTLKRISSPACVSWSWNDHSAAGPSIYDMMVRTRCTLSVNCTSCALINAFIWVVHAGMRVKSFPSNLVGVAIGTFLDMDVIFCVVCMGCCDANPCAMEVDMLSVIPWMIAWSCSAVKDMVGSCGVGSLGGCGSGDGNLLGGYGSGSMGVRGNDRIGVLWGLGVV